MIHPGQYKHLPPGLADHLQNGLKQGFYTEADVLDCLRRNRWDKRTGTPDGCHRHKCKKCNLVWFHADDLEERVDFFTHYTAHFCPNCHTGQFEKYGGRLMPLCCHVPTGGIPVGTGMTDNS